MKTIEQRLSDLAIKRKDEQMIPIIQDYYILMNYGMNEEDALYHLEQADNYKEYVKKELKTK